MKKKILALCAAGVAMAGLNSVPASAAEITYILSGTFDVTLNATTYHNVGITATAIGDTNNAVPTVLDGTIVPLSSFSAAIASMGTYALPASGLDFFVYRNTSTAGVLINGGPAVLGGFTASPLSTYSGTSSIGPIPVTYIPGVPITFSSNTVTVSNGQNVNFSASVASVPEPASWALMIGGFGLAGAVLRRRRTSIAYAA